MNRKIAELYRLILKHNWAVEKVVRHQNQNGWSKDIAVIEIELVSPHKMVDHYAILGPPGTSHG